MVTREEGQLYEEGTKFVVKGSDYFSDGAVVVLKSQDGSSCPEFISEGCRGGTFEYWTHMTPVEGRGSVSKSKGGVMSNIVKKIKDLALSKDDRLLREQGITDECGQLTEEGRQVLEQVLFTAHKGAVVTLVQNVADAEKAEKKKK